MNSLYFVSVWIHIAATLFWIGGMWFLVLVGAPVLRRMEPPELRSDIFRKLGERFRSLGWVAVGLLLATGTLNLSVRGLLSAELLGSRGFWQTRYGEALAWKLTGVAAMIAGSLVHDFYLGPLASLLEPGSQAQATARQWAVWLARVNAVIGLGVTYAATILVRG